MKRLLASFLTAIALSGCPSSETPGGDQGSPADLTMAMGDGSPAGCAPACSGVTPFCNPTKHCVGCLVDGDCAKGSYCKVTSDAIATCTPGCTGDGNCANGQKCCDSQCSDTATDVKHCGGCGMTCGAIHSTASCAAGQCVPGKCEAGWGDCNKDPKDGCEANLHADADNCTGCGMKCEIPNAFAACSDGCYSTACKFGFDDCNMNMMDGCEASVLTNPASCGACGKVCNGLPNAKANCTAGNCVLGMCNPGFADCNKDPKDGCEVNLNADGKNCNGCGNVCPMQTPACSKGICGLTFRSCNDIVKQGKAMGDGVYTVDPGNGPIQVYCDMTTDGGGWTIMAYLRTKVQWDINLFTDSGVVGDVPGGFASGLTLKNANDTFKEKIIIYLNLVENNMPLGKAWMINARVDNVAIPFASINTPNGWNYRDSYNFSEATVTDVCTHGCTRYRTFGMFHDFPGVLKYCGTQGGDNGCRDGNNICWMPRGQGCNVGAGRCAYLTMNGEGVLYGAR